METVIAEQSAENMTYVRRLLRQKQSGFAAALELAVLLAEQRLGQRRCGAHDHAQPQRPCPMGYKAGLYLVMLGAWRSAATSPTSARWRCCSAWPGPAA